ncbi:Indoleamine 2,3-dioxygenase [Extremus antarcticus]|uniref:Indoleamine 2,3-dioxygenase n=1 Tax=Extremus antarcticus TaxID=702011 RepID=A0AAJ0GGR0_9PEZI|nr:Indoleamine 2,3-dioxygenase [Extremus antarcticus]
MTENNPINPSSFGISPKYGFLSPTAPLTTFSNPYYQPWDTITSNLSSLIASNQLHDAVAQLPLLHTNKLIGELEYRRAYVVLAFLAHAYVWSKKQPDGLIPPQISEPFLEVCEYHRIQPVITYTALCTWNWKLRNGGTFELQDMEPLASFTGTRGEAAFYHVPVLVEWEGGCLMHLLIGAIGAVASGDRVTVVDALEESSRSIVRMGEQLSKMYANLDADAFYHELRPFFAGGKGMEEKGLHRGMVFQKSDGSEICCKLVGGSAVQSSLFPFIDCALGVEHNDDALFKEMRAYMPGQHRDFLEEVSRLPSLRNYVQDHVDDTELREAYDGCLTKLRAWRGKHIAIVSKYIVQPAREAARASVVEKIEVDASDAAKDEWEIQGTGGSALMPFLRQARDDTKGVDI